MFEVIEGGKSVLTPTQVADHIRNIKFSDLRMPCTSHDHYIHNPDDKSHVTIFRNTFYAFPVNALLSIVADELDHVGLSYRNFDAMPEVGTVAMRVFEKSIVLFFEPEVSVTAITFWLSLDRRLKNLIGA